MNIPKTMQAAVLMGPNDVQLREVAVPVPGPADVLIRVEACALCSTDVSLIASPLPGQPPYGEFIIGHEYAGTVVAVGDTVDEFAAGQRVAVEAHLGCLRCANCRVGNYTACLNYGNRRKGHRANGFTTNGGLAQFVVNHLNTVYAIPPTVGFDEAALITNLGCALYGFESLGGYVAGQTIAVIGPGPLGLIAALAAKALAAGKVILVGTRESRLKVARTLGLDRVINSENENAHELILSETGGRGAEIVVEASGSESGLSLAIKSTRRMGKILLLGFAHQPIAADFESLALDNKSIHTVRGEGWANVARAISLAGSGLVNLKPLVTHRFALEQIQEGFHTFVNRVGGAIKVIIKPNPS